MVEALFDSGFGRETVVSDNRRVHGLYVVYLFSKNLNRAYLSLMQGVTELVDRHGQTEGRRRLAAQATALRDTVAALDTYGSSMDLESSAPRPKGYEAGNVAARAYDLADLPANETLEADLREAIRHYQLVIEARNALRISQPDLIETTAPANQPTDNGVFKPKDDAEYKQVITERVLVKKRSHERVVKLFGEYVQANGRSARTDVHPRDLVLDSGQPTETLVEVKIVRNGDGVGATREALSQLLMYRDFLYGPSSSVKLLAVFNESIGEANIAFLARYGISVAWSDDGSWKWS